MGRFGKRLYIHVTSNADANGKSIKNLTPEQIAPQQIK